MLLPWIPGRAFSVKGGQVGLAWALPVLAYKWNNGDAGVWGDVATLLSLPAISAYLALNFTGSSTYTSVSGVRKEMRWGLPAIAGAGIIGTIVFAVGLVAG